MTNMNGSAHSVLAMLLLSAAFAIAPRASAAESAKGKTDAWEAERREAAMEEQNEMNMTLAEQARVNRQFKGLLELGKEDNPDVVGSFYETQGNAVAPSAVKYGIKVQNKALVDVLKNYNGKKVEVEGKLRNGGKYLLVTRVVEKAPGQARTERRAFGGL